MTDIEFLLDGDARRKHNAQYAREHAQRGNYSVALGYDHGVVVVAYNPRMGLGFEKVREVHHHVALLGSGRPNDVESATEHAIFEADVTELRYSAQDVLPSDTAKTLSRYAQGLFSSPEPLGAILLVVGLEGLKNTMFKVLYDGESLPSEDFASIGGPLSEENENWIEQQCREKYHPGQPLDAAILFGVDCIARAVANDRSDEHLTQPEAFETVLEEGKQLEVAVLDKRITDANKFAPISSTRLRHEFAPMTVDELKSVFQSYASAQR